MILSSIQKITNHKKNGGEKTQSSKIKVLILHQVFFLRFPDSVTIG